MILSNRVSFWDGDNFVVVNKNCSKEQALKMMQALSAADLGLEEIAPALAKPVTEPAETLPEIPEDVPETDRVLDFGVYEGKTPEEVMENADSKGKAFANLTFYQALYGKKGDTFMEHEIRGVLTKWFHILFGKMEDPYLSVAKWSEKKCETFFKLYGGILTTEEKATLADQGRFSHFDQMMEESTFDQKKSLIAEIIRKYK